MVVEYDADIEVEDITEFTAYDIDTGKLPVKETIPLVSTIKLDDEIPSVLRIVKTGPLELGFPKRNSGWVDIYYYFRVIVSFVE